LSLTIGLLVMQPVAAATSAGPTGTWLLRADHVDPYIETGVVLPMYPVLQVGEDGHFALFFISAYCFDHRADDIDFSGSRVDEWARCDAMRHSAHFPSPHHLFVRPAASGRWSVEGTRMQLRVERTSEPLYSFGLDQNRRLDAPRDFAGAAERLNAARQAGPAFSPATAERFYGDFFILGGGTLDFSLASDMLKLTQPGQRDQVVFEPVAPGALDQAMAIVRALEVPSGDFFRCVLANTRDPGRSSIPEGEWKRLVQLAGEVSADQEGFRHARALSADGQEDEAMRVWPMAARERANARIATQMMAQPVIKAAQAGHLGAYLGCPERDEAGQ
jgi:hypothetical protein